MPPYLKAPSLFATLFAWAFVCLSLNLYREIRGVRVGGQALVQTSIDNMFSSLPDAMCQKAPRGDAFLRYRPSIPVEGTTARDRPPNSADVTQHHPMTSAAFHRTSQRTLGRPL